MNWWPMSVTRLRIIDLGTRGQHSSLGESSACRISHYLSPLSLSSGDSRGLRPGVIPTASYPQN